MSKGSLTNEELSMILNDLYLFYRAFITSNMVDSSHAPHIEALSIKLTELYLGDFKRLCVAMPPRHSKSSMVTLAYPLWLIFQNPNLNILVINNSASLSEKFGIDLREKVKQFGPMFNVCLSDVKHASNHLMFEDRKGKLYDGSIRLVGAGGSITGQDADYLIIDDPYKGYEDITPTLLQKKIDWFNTIVEQRIEPHTKLMILHTRWHSNDLQGYLKKNFKDNYEFIEFPAILDNGEPLWPQRYNTDLLEKKREAVGERLFQSIFQQKPIDEESNFFDLNRIHWCSPDPELSIEYQVRGYDIASSEPGKNDYTAGVPMFLMDDGETVLITDYLYGQFGSDTGEMVKQTVKSDGPDNISLIETGVAAAGKLLYENWEDQLPGYFLERAMVVPNKSKADRATPLKDYIYDGKVYVDIKDDKLRKTFQDEFNAFPNSIHDDIVDATAHAFNYLNKEFIQLDMFEIIDI